MPKFLETVDDVVDGATDLIDKGKEVLEDVTDFVDDFLGSKGGFYEDTHVQSIRKASRLYGLQDETPSKIPRLAFQFYVRVNYDGEFHDYVDTFSIGSYSEHPNYVKSVTVPTIDVETEKLLSYNRYRINQTKLNYSPVDITFRDIADGRTSVLWKMYSDFYFKDGIPNKPDSVVYEKIVSDTHESVNEFGYNPLHYYESENRQLFKSIEIFQFYGKGSFNKVTLHNPKITKYSQTQMSVESSDLVDLNYTFEYEWAEYQYDLHTETDEPEIYENFFSENKVDHLDFQIWDSPPPPPSGLIADIMDIVDTVEDAIEVVDTVKGVVKTVAGVVSKVSSTVNQLQMDILGKDEPPMPLPDGRSIEAAVDNVPTNWQDVKRVTRKANRPGGG